MELITKSNFSEKLLNYELKQPKPMRGGSYIFYLVKNDKNVFVQVPKCNTKQGIVTSGKKCIVIYFFHQQMKNISNLYNGLKI